MRKNDKAIFKDKNKLTIKLNLRLNGYSVESLATIYGCDRTSISNQCDKYDIVPVDKVYGIERFFRKIIPKEDTNFRSPSHWMIIDGERINMGHSYKEYFYPPRK